uniref:RRM domain-containing protein n=1 Tax=Knipowitschia caucasica TaxID=637954 RepID=A0AAV2JU77_KNICA
MNPSNPFGSTQSGAFQAPNPAGKVGPFQPVFGQSSAAQAQSSGGFFGSGFGQTPNTSMFGQAFGQAAPAPQSGPVFGHASSTPLQPPPAFGQTTTQQNASIFGQTLTTTATTQQPAAPAFSHQGGSVFGGSNAPAFGQTAAQQNQTSIFGQNSSFGSNFAASGITDEGFSSQSGAFTAQKQAPQFGHAPTPSSGLGFAQPVFGQPTSTASTTSVFGTSTNTSQSRGFSTSDFSFKPSNEALFKPIISAGPDPNTTTAQSGFGEAPSGLFQNKPALSGFSFSQPAPLPGSQRTVAPSLGGAGGLQFTFSQPATPASGSKAGADAGQPTTPSTFSFTTKTLFGGSKFSEASREKEQSGAEQSGAEPTAETNVFARLGKRKEESPGASPLKAEKEAQEEDLGGDSDAPRQPPKRPLVRSRGPPSGPPPGLFGRALSGLRRDLTAPGKRTSASPLPRLSACPPLLLSPSPLLLSLLPVLLSLLPVLPSPSLLLPSPSPLLPPPLLSSPTSRLGQRSDSTDSLSGASPNECTALQCRDLPPVLNRREVLEKHFRQFGRVRRVLCRPQRNSAMVYFHDHASAVKAKRKGRTLNKFEMQLFWWKKKHAADRGPGVDSELQQEVQDLAETVVSVPMKRPALRPSALGVSFG